jgi:hypothetical protein
LGTEGYSESSGCLSDDAASMNWSQIKG